MVRLGCRLVGIYPDSGIQFGNYGGTIIFKGKCRIGNNSAISVRHGCLVFGEGVAATAQLKLVCYHKITLGAKTLIGWDCLISDTDFHQLKTSNGQMLKSYGPISIGSCCWIGYHCTILKNTQLPSYTVVASNSLVNKKYNISEKSLIAGQPAKMLKNDVYRDPDDDIIEYLELHE